MGVSWFSHCSKAQDILMQEPALYLFCGFFPPCTPEAIIHGGGTGMWCLFSITKFSKVRLNKLLPRSPQSLFLLLLLVRTG